jgi:hypothetical protein
MLDSFVTSNLLPSDLNLSNTFLFRSLEGCKLNGLYLKP